MTKRLDTVVITYHHYIHRHDHYDDRDHHHHHNCHHHHRYRFLDRISARLLTSIIPIQSLTQTIKRQDGGPTSITRTPQTKSSEEEIFVGGNYVIFVRYQHLLFGSSSIKHVTLYRGLVQTDSPTFAQKIFGAPPCLSALSVIEDLVQHR